MAKHTIKLTRLPSTKNLISIVITCTDTGKVEDIKDRPNHMEALEEAICAYPDCEIYDVDGSPMELGPPAYYKG